MFGQSSIPSCWENKLSDAHYFQDSTSDTMAENPVGNPNIQLELRMRASLSCHLHSFRLDLGHLQVVPVMSSDRPLCRHCSVLGLFVTLLVLRYVQLGLRLVFVSSHHLKIGHI